jgi:hypothetical protein
MIDDFAKQDMVRGVSLDDVFTRPEVGTPEENEGRDMVDAMVASIQAMYSDTSPKELEGYYVHRIIYGDRVYYPVKDTLRPLNTGWIIFQDALNESEVAWITLPAKQQQPIYYWVPNEETAAPAIVFPVAA